VIALALRGSPLATISGTSKLKEATIARDLINDPVGISLAVLFGTMTGHIAKLDSAFAVYR